MFKLFVCVLLAGLAVGISGHALADEQSFGVSTPAFGTRTSETSEPSISQDLAAGGFVPLGPDSTPVPMTTRGFDPGNGTGNTFGVPPAPSAPKVQ